MIFDGIFYDFEIKITYKDKGEYGFFPILLVGFPLKITSFNFDAKYKILPPDSDPVQLNIVVDDELLRQKVIQLGLHDLQFYSPDSEKTMRKQFFIRKDLLDN